jgi:alpha-beta hydrolase superfamily lysophospholipase
MLNHPLNTHDGLNLNLQFWSAAPHSMQRGVVLIVHGLGEHIERYEPFALWLREKGWWIVGYDQRGHGRSAGDRGHIDRPEDLLNDLGLVIKRLRALGPQLPGPLVLLGHSLGGTVAARYVAEGLSATPAPWWRPVDALVLSSPAFALRVSWIQRLLALVAERILPRLAVRNGLRAQWLSHDTKVVESYSKDPLAHDRITARLLRFALTAGARVRNSAKHWAIPTLLMYAEDDLCVAPQGSEAFASAAPTDRVSTRAYPDVGHELFNEREPERGRMLHDLAQWLELFAVRHKAAGHST